MKQVKRVVMLMLVLVLSVQPLSRTRLLAAAETGIELQAVNFAGCNVHLRIDSDGACKCVAQIMAEPGTSKIAGTMKLKKVTSTSTTTVKSWNISTTEQYLNVTKTCYVLSKGTYRLEVSVKATRNGKTESLKNSVTVQH